MIDLFDVWGIAFICAFLSFHWMKYILVVGDFVPKWVEEIAIRNHEGKSVHAFLKKEIFSKFGTPRAIISMVPLTSVINCLKGYWRNMVFSIMWQLLTMHILEGKLRCPIEILRKF